MRFSLFVFPLLQTAALAIGLGWPAHAAWREANEAVQSRGGIGVHVLAARAAAKDGGDAPGAPGDIVVFFPGAEGRVRQARDGLAEHGERASLIGSFAERLGMAVAIGLPTDRKDGLPVEWRTGKEHVADAGAVIDGLAMRFPGARLTLVGMSNGTRSVTHVAAAIARRGTPKLRGVVAMAAVPDALNATAMSAIAAANISVLVVHHKRDSCIAWSEVESQARRYDQVLVEDDRHPRVTAANRECGTTTAHQFAGKEVAVYAAIADWILTGKVKEPLL
jgi:alpha/beta superfamily hydrolase